MHYINYSSDFRCSGVVATTRTQKQMGCVCRLSRCEEAGKWKNYEIFEREKKFYGNDKVL